jgi:hypothetical protein
MKKYTVRSCIICTIHQMTDDQIRSMRWTWQVREVRNAYRIRIGNVKINFSLDEKIILK